MTTEERLFDEAIRIARGRSGVEPSVHHLIAFDLTLTRISEENEVLRRSLALLNQLNQESLEMLRRTPAQGSV